MVERSCTALLIIITLVSILIFAAAQGIVALNCCSAALLLITGVCPSDDSTRPPNQPDSSACRIGAQ